MATSPGGKYHTTRLLRSGALMAITDLSRLGNHRTVEFFSISLTPDDSKHFNPCHTARVKDIPWLQLSFKWKLQGQQNEYITCFLYTASLLQVVSAVYEWLWTDLAKQSHSSWKHGGNVGCYSHLPHWCHQDSICCAEQHWAHIQRDHTCTVHYVLSGRIPIIISRGFTFNTRYVFFSLFLVELKA